MPDNLSPEQSAALTELQRRRATLSPQQQSALDELVRRQTAGSTPSVQSTIRDDSGKVIPGGNPVERFAGGMWDELPNIRQVLQGMAQATSQPLTTLGNLSQRQWDMLKKADQAMDKGDYLGAIRYAVGFGIPVVGPPAAELGEDPDTLHALGRATTQGLLNVAPGPATQGRRFGIPGIRNRNPVEAGALEYLSREGMTVPAGTATGNMALRAGEQLAGRTIGGSRVAQATEAANAQVARELAGRLADEVHPYPVTAEQAGQGIRGQVEAGEAARQGELLDTGGTLANQVYPGPITPEQAGTAVQEGVRRTAAGTEAGIRTAGEQTATRVHPSAVVPELAGRALQAEGQGRVVALNEAANEAYTPFHEAAKSPRYQRQVQTGVDAKGKPILERMNMPVWISDLQSILRPLVREWEMLVEPAKRNASPGFTAAKSIVNWEKGGWMPAELAEKALGGLKDLSRKGKYEGSGGEAFAKAMRDENQGVAALAVTNLQKVIDGAVAKADPAAMSGLQQGRRLIAQKYDVADTVSQLRPEPVQAYGQMTYGKDAGIDFARSMAGIAPGAVPQVGRALLDSLMDEAATNFTSAANKWNSVGESTKQLYFPDPQTRAGIDRYFSEGARHAENQVRLSAEPVKLYQGMTARGDSNIEFARDIAKAAPAEVPKIGKAFIDSLMEKARTPEGWKQAYRDWQNLGEETKQILYRNPDTRTGLEFFFEAGQNLGEGSLTKQLAAEPVAIYNRLTRVKDADIGFLRQMQRETPAEIPKVGRAWLEGAINKATAEGGWGRAQGILADWQKLGDETKKILFPNPLMRENLNKFFTGTKRMGEAVNPSGTATALITAAEGGMWLNALGDAAKGNLLPLATAGGISLGGYALARLLYSPKGTALLMRGMTMPAKHPAAAMLGAQLLKLAGGDDNRKTR